MALEDDIAAMNRNRVQRGMCLTVDDLAMQIQTHQGSLTNVVNELVTQIDVIETGGGVKVVIGQATAAVTGSDFQIDNIVSLTDGFTAPSAPLDVVNILGFSCDDNTYVYAVLNPATDEWLGWTDTGGIGGGSYSAGFCIDSTELAGGSIALISTGNTSAALQFFCHEHSDAEGWVTPDSYDDSAEQVIAHDNGALKCINIDVIEIDLV